MGEGKDSRERAGTRTGGLCQERMETWSGDH